MPGVDVYLLTRWRHVDAALVNLLAVDGVGGRKLPETGQDCRQSTRRVRTDVQDDEDGGWQAGGKRRDDLRQRLHAAGGGADDDDVVMGHAGAILCKLNAARWMSRGFSRDIASPTA